MRKIIYILCTITVIIIAILCIINVTKFDNVNVIMELDKNVNVEIGQFCTNSIITFTYAI